MRRIELLYAAVTIAALGVAVAVPYVTHERGSKAVPGWQAMVSPGPLSRGHRFLADDCEACHVPHRGVGSEQCIPCHANDEPLLARQTTRFHADVGACGSCHVEHRGPDVRPISMDHELLAGLGVRARPLPADLSLRSLPTPHARIKPAETILDCNACHSDQDVHRTYFGDDCAGCHATSSWKIPEYRHPSALSTDCAQCHAAPPSHYGEHFRMVSMKVARIENADVSQCFLCHQTNDWNSIKGVGWYDHH